MTDALPDVTPTATTQAATTQPAKKKRSRIERIIVQGGIAVMLALVAVEGWAYLRMNLAHGQLMSELRRAESDDHRITKEMVGKILGGRQPDESVPIKVAVGEERYDLYYFSGLLKTRELCVHYGVQGKFQGEPEVIEVTSVIPDEVLAKTSESR